MKKLLSIFSLLSFCLLISCNTGTSEEDTEDRAEDINEEKFSAASDEGAEFVVEAYSFNLMLIEYAKQMENNIPPRVEDYVTNAERFHSQLNSSLEKLAKEHQITLPNTIGENVIKQKEDLLEQEGKDLIDEYLDTVDDIQEEMIMAYQTSAEGVMDRDIKLFAEKTLSSLRNRQELVEELDKYLETIDVGVISEQEEINDNQEGLN